MSAYDTLREAGSSFDVVLVSLDNSADEMFGTMKRYAMPWLATPFSRERTQALIARYDVQWIPTLLVIDGACETVSRTGREDLLSRGAGAYAYWLAQGGAR